MQPHRTEELSPLVSVIVATYNRASILNETLHSILGQTYSNLEVLVISDGSTDETESMVKSFNDNRLRLFQRQNNAGFPSIVRNEGLRRARGTYIAFCDDDDIWLPQKLERQIAVLEDDPTLLAVGSNMVYFPDVFLLGYPLLHDKRLDYLWQLHHPNHLCNSSVVMRREVIDLIGFQDENPALRAVEDFDYWLRILQARDHSILVLKDTLVKYRMHQSNISEIKDDRKDTQMHDRMILVFRKHLPVTQNLVSKMEDNRDLMIRKAFIKRQFYHSTISWLELLRASNISLKFKLEVLVKKPILLAFFLFRHIRDFRRLAY